MVRPTVSHRQHHSELTLSITYCFESRFADSRQTLFTRSAIQSPARRRTYWKPVIGPTLLASQHAMESGKATCRDGSITSGGVKS